MDAMEILESRRSEIESLCRLYGVKRLRVFGSATTGAWDPATSDFDFLVEFGPEPPGITPLSQLVEFHMKLEALLGRAVDLVEKLSSDRPIFKAQAEATARNYFVA